MPAHVALLSGIASTAIALLLPLGAAGAAPSSDPALPGPFKAGTQTVSVTRANGTSFQATLHYPATVEAGNAPFDASGAPYPAITFGHGFLQPVTQYASTLKHLATHGFMVIASQSEGGLFPSHPGLAADMRACLDWLEESSADPLSPFVGSVDIAAFGASGHSMGGGCAILATRDDPRIVALAPLAAADTNPSSVGAIGQVTVPLRLIAGSEDSIVPPGSSSVLMYSNADAPRQLQVIQGGFHCGFIDANSIFCDSGSITRAQQLGITRRLLAEFFLLHLGEQQALWSSVWGPGVPPAAETTTSLDSGALVVADPAEIIQHPGEPGSAQVTVTNFGPLPSTFTLFAEGAAGWTVSFEPASTPLLAAGESATIALSVTASAGALARSAVISARREVDGGTRAWSAIELDPGLPSPDLNGDGVVDGADLGILLAAWGQAGSPADLNEDGTVDGADLGILLSAW
jgi:predicted dienelactone hydrolase